MKRARKHISPILLPSEAFWLRAIEVFLAARVTRYKYGCVRLEERETERQRDRQTDRGKRNRNKGIAIQTGTDWNTKRECQQRTHHYYTDLARMHYVKASQK